jgi:hypothetical protein
VKVCTDSTAPDQLGKNTSLLIEDDELAPYCLRISTLPMRALA